MQSLRWRSWRVAAFAFVGLAAQAAPLPQLVIDPAGTTVSGLSSGGFQSGGYAYANGSNQNMGLWNVFIVTTLKQTGPNYYLIGSCP